MRNWYRMAGVKTFHAASDDWVRSGRAVCGANIHAPGWAACDDSVKQCKRCLRKLSA